MLRPWLGAGLCLALVLTLVSPSWAGPRAGGMCVRVPSTPGPMSVVDDSAAPAAPALPDDDAACWRGYDPDGRCVRDAPLVPQSGATGAGALDLHLLAMAPDAPELPDPSAAAASALDQAGGPRDGHAARLERPPRI